MLNLQQLDERNAAETSTLVLFILPSSLLSGLFITHCPHLHPPPTYTHTHTPAISPLPFVSHPSLSPLILNLHPPLLHWERDPPVGLVKTKKERDREWAGERKWEGARERERERERERDRERSSVREREREREIWGKETTDLKTRGKKDDDEKRLKLGRHRKSERERDLLFDNLCLR